MDVIEFVVGIVIIVSVPLLFLIFLLSNVAETYGNEMEKRIKNEKVEVGYNLGPKPTLRLVIVAYLVMTVVGLASMLQTDTIVRIFGITVQAFAIMTAMTALVFTIIVMNIWKQKIEGNPVPY